MALGSPVLLVLLLLLPHLTTLGEGNDVLFQGFRQAGDRISTQGSAFVTAGGALHLTNDTGGYSAGRVFLPSPVSMRDSSNRYLSFSTNFVFAIVPPALPFVPGCGLTFVIAASTDFDAVQLGPGFGIFNQTATDATSFEVFAVEFDTTKTPWFQDPDDNHVGVDIDSAVSIVTESASYYPDGDTGGGSVPLRLASGQPIQAWIDYDAAENILNVTIASLNTTRPRRAMLSHSLNLSSVLAGDMYVGLASSTASHNYTASHYILAWSFSTGRMAQPLNVTDLPAVPVEPRTTPSLLSSLSGLEIGLISSAITLVSIAGIILFVMYLRRRSRLAETTEAWELEHPHRIPYKELYRATKGFSEAEVIGKGGFGRVYHGVLRRSGEEEVAIKKISSNTWQGIREFVAEVASLGRLRHRNLVELRGWCKCRNEMLLVYEFMPKGSLDSYLFVPGDKGEALPAAGMLLSWKQRFKIVKGVSLGLLYLHEEWEQVVVHRDIKASNVLLAADMTAKLSDFGLARFYDHDGDPHTTNVVGTMGYMAPELSMGKATTGSDVFAFGVLLLEVACGRRPIESRVAPREVHLVCWAANCAANGTLLSTADPRLEGCFVEEEMLLVLRLGLVCTQVAPEARPSMRQVVRYLHGDEQLPNNLLEVPFWDAYSFGGESSTSSSQMSRMLQTTNTFGTMTASSVQGEGR